MGGLVAQVERVCVALSAAEDQATRAEHQAQAHQARAAEAAYNMESARVSANNEEAATLTAQNASNGVSASTEPHPMCLYVLCCSNCFPQLAFPG